MLCDECGKNPARIKMVSVVGGEKREVNLCPECAARHNLTPQAGGMGKLFSALFGAEKNNAADKLVCEKCGMRFSQALKTQRAGCPGCYVSFRAQIAAGLKKRQGADTHTGRALEYHGESKEETISELQREMELAVACENFEAAAALRDAIRALAACEGGSADA